MKVKVKHFLNVRAGKPSVNAPCYQYLAPGSEIEVDGKLYKGDPFEDINTWLKDDGNNYYWSGGVESILPAEASAPVNLLDSSVWWYKDFNIGALWSKGLNGADVKIAVLDSGISLPHADLNIVDANLKDLSDSGTGIKDWTGHGTHVCGIIKAGNVSGLGIRGVAFESRFYLGKITHDIHGDEKVELLIKGIEWAIENSVNIISISNGRRDNNAGLEAIIKKAFANKILIVCAAGNKDAASGNEILYPARYDETLSVGGITQTKIPLPDSINSNNTDLFAPGEAIRSTSLKNNYASLSGSSQAAPYVAGVAALLLQAAKKENGNFDARDLKNELIKHADSRPFGRLINPLETYKQIVK
jgi:subtilisin family serine protease